MDLLVLVAAVIPMPGEAPADYWSGTGYEEEAGVGIDVSAAAT